jgi:hypothetical protein
MAIQNGDDVLGALKQRPALVMQLTSGYQPHCSQRWTPVEQIHCVTVRWWCDL